MARRSRLLSHKISKQEQELHIITNPLVHSRLSLLNNDDYRAPLTSHTLSPNSKWIIVRNNIHKIRSWGGINTSNVEKQYQDWYLLFQMRRELRHAKKSIQEIEHRPNFIPIHYFDLPLDETHVRHYNVSHVQSSDVLYHPSFGSEPVVLQSFLYYFSKECAVPYSSIFRPFLSDVCSILYQDQQRLNRAALFRKFALTMTIIISIFLALMLFSLIFSVLTTTSKLTYMYKDDPDGGIEWRQP